MTDDILRGIITLAQSGLSGAAVDASKGGLSGGIPQTPNQYQTTPVVVPKPVYQKYNLPASDAYSYGEPVGTNLLSTQNDAVTLAMELNATGLPFLTLNENVVYGSSGRKKWMLTIPNVSIPINVGLAICSKYRAGMGAPGHWAKSGLGIVWVLDDASSDPWQIDPAQVVAL